MQWVQVLRRVPEAALPEVLTLAPLAEAQGTDLRGPAGAVPAPRAPGHDLEGLDSATGAAREGA